MTNKGLEKGVKALFEKTLTKYRKSEKEVSGDVDIKYKDPFAGTEYYTDKVMIHKSSRYGIISSVHKKPRESNVLLLVTYDGTGYDLLSLKAYYGGGIARKDFEKLLKKKYGDKVYIEHNTSWSFSVYGG